MLSVGIGCIVYAYVLLLRLPVGLPRLVAFLPWLPILLHSACNVPGVHLGGLVSFFFLWMIPFKMLLLCWNAGHARDPAVTTSFLRFLAVMGLSIHIPPPDQTGKQQGLRDESEAKLAWWEWIEGSLAWQAVVIRAVLKLGMVVLLFEWVYAYRGRGGMPDIVLYLAYSLHVYLACSLAFELLAAGAAACLGVRLEPQFDKPFLATSLADFWGRRWNRLVSSVLRASVYEPLFAMMRSRGGGNEMNKVVAMLGTFLVSGLMHELIFLVLNNSTHPTWQVTGFFLVQGVATVLENKVIPRSSTSTWWRRVLTLGFILATARCLFFPPIHNTGTCDKALSEFEHFLGFFRSSF